MKQSSKPQPKVVAAGLGGACATLVIYAAGLKGIDVTPEAAGALATVFSAIFGYIKRG